MDQQEWEKQRIQRLELLKVELPYIIYPVQIYFLNTTLIP